VIRADGALNFADLARPFPAESEPAEPEEPPRLFIELFRMTEGHARFEDRTLATPYATDFRPLSFELRDFSTITGSDNAYDLHAQAGTGATLDWSGQFTLAPLASVATSVHGVAVTGLERVGHEWERSHDRQSGSEIGRTDSDRDRRDPRDRPGGRPYPL